MALKVCFLGAVRRRTFICCRNIQVSASSAARDRSRSPTIQTMSLTRSLIPQQHRPILNQLLVRLSLRQGQRSLRRSPAKHIDLLPQDQVFRFQRCSRLEARSQDNENQPEQIGHQDGGFTPPPFVWVYAESNFRYTQPPQESKETSDEGGVCNEDSAAHPNDCLGRGRIRAGLPCRNTNGSKVPGPLVRE